ncbi:unnamed protein product [Hermetia illucens]|uniref:Uncharacterized protein n=1 Tax=Hermetia illucens TaxID=343691 RepID=A0A7R8UMU3_HERIL|nr:unnamed protein product [Hermetia illucens]
MLSSTEYTNRHNSVCKILHQNLALKYNLVATYHPYYKYTPQRILENDRVKLLWDHTIATDHSVNHNRPDLVLLLKEERACFIIDVAVPLDRNTVEKQYEKIRNYGPLADDMKQTWRLQKMEVVPVVISATGLVPQNLHKALKTLDLRAGLYMEMQKAVILATCAIVRRVLSGDNLT